MNKSEKVTVKRTRDTAVMDIKSRDADDDLKKLFEAATILRKAIHRSEVWTFNGSLHDVTKDNLPNELYSFFVG